MIKKISQKNNGFVTLFVVIIIGFALVVYLTSTSRTSVLKLENNRLANNRQSAYYLADSCAEIALQKIRNENFIGNNTFNTSIGVCDYSISNQGGENRTINVTANVNQSIQRVLIQTDQINPKINVTSWRHIKD